LPYPPRCTAFFQCSQKLSSLTQPFFFQASFEETIDLVFIGSPSGPFFRDKPSFPRSTNSLSFPLFFERESWLQYLMPIPFLPLLIVSSPKAYVWILSITVFSPLSFFCSSSQAVPFGEVTNRSFPLARIPLLFCASNRIFHPFTFRAYFSLQPFFLGTIESGIRLAFRFSHPFSGGELFPHPPPPQFAIESFSPPPPPLLVNFFFSLALSFLPPSPGRIQLTELPWSPSLIPVPDPPPTYPYFPWFLTFSCFSFFGGNLDPPQLIPNRCFPVHTSTRITISLTTSSFTRSFPPSSVLFPNPLRPDRRTPTFPISESPGFFYFSEQFCLFGLLSGRVGSSPW